MCVRLCVSDCVKRTPNREKGERKKVRERNEDKLGQTKTDKQKKYEMEKMN